MSSICSISEPSILIPVQYTWAIEASKYNGENGNCKLESPVFGPENCWDTVKFRLNLNRAQKVDKIMLQLVSCNIDTIDFHFNITHNGTTKSSSTLQKLNPLSQITLWNSSTNTITTPYEKEFLLVILKPYIPEMQLITDLGALRTQPELSDVVLVIGDREFPAHKNILLARSPVFRAMFAHADLKENKENRVELIDISVEVLKGLLDFVYTGTVASLDELAPNLLPVAHKVFAVSNFCKTLTNLLQYQIDTLVQVCEQSMVQNITNENAANFLNLSDLYSLKKLKEETLNFINNDPYNVMESDGWKKLINDNLELIRELYMNLVSKYVQNEMPKIVFEY